MNAANESYYDWPYNYDVEQAANEETKASLRTGAKSANG